MPSGSACRWAAVLGLASTSTWRLPEAWNPPWVMQSTWLPSGTAFTQEKSILNVKNQIT